MPIPAHLRDAFNTHMRNLITTAGLNETSAEHQFGEMIAWLGEEQRKLAKAAGEIWPKKVYAVMNLEAFAFSSTLLELQKHVMETEPHGHALAHAEVAGAFVNGIIDDLSPPSLTVIEGGKAHEDGT